MYYDKGLVSKETLVLLHVCICPCNVVMSWSPEMFLLHNLFIRTVYMRVFCF